MEKTFLIGLGAQKAGTTWVHSYLKAHPECATGKVKELSVLTGYFSNRQGMAPRVKMKINALREELDLYERRTRNNNDNAEANKQLLYAIDYLAADHDLEYYLSYARRLLADNPGAKLVSDITPAYSTLKPENILETRTLLEAEGCRPKALFLMRDPVERCYSALRMGARNKAWATKTDIGTSKDNFFANATADWCQVRTRYENIVPAIEAAFGAENCLFAFYETFISEPGVRSLCDFLDISYVAPKLDHKVNASPRTEEPDPAEWAQVRETYKDTYQFCADRFGADAVAQVWPEK
ncbi:sulfotransferase [uncultured Tateyamaria sp.]|uniref:sulfotransferase n=1 Tax=uncultured Tateyamaria sp. TaxID=455651 RepID=UPI00260FB15E|nr:sulfotransferase [uncultured Tateyamaria sp.]